MSTNGSKTSEFKLSGLIAVLITLVEVLSQTGILGDKWSPVAMQGILAAKAFGYTGARTYFKGVKAKAEVTIESAKLSLKAKMPTPE